MRGLLNLGILTVRGPLQPPFIAPLINCVVDGAPVEANGQGHAGERLTVERIQKDIVKAQEAFSDLAFLWPNANRYLRQQFEELVLYIITIALERHRGIDNLHMLGYKMAKADVSPA